MTLGRFFRVVRHRMASIRRPTRLDADVERELAFHLDALMQEGVADGLSADDARRAAHRALGNPALLQEACRDERGVRWWHDAQQDLVYGWRVLRRRPGFAAAAISSLAIGIGANATMLGAIDAVLVHRLPFHDADRLVAIQGARVDHPDQITGVSLADYLDWSERQRSFQSLGLSMPWPGDIIGDPTGAPPEHLLGQLFTPEMFETLGAQAALGRTFTKDEGQLGDAARVIVISDGLWRRRFAADPAVVGTSVRIDLVERTVIGVMAPDFQYRDAHADFWLPLIVNRRPGQNPSRLFGIVGRLKPGVTIADARAEFATLDAQFSVEAPDRHKGWTSRLFPLRDAMYSWTITPLLTLEAAVVLLLVVTCVNIAALLLVRGATRQPEIRLRLALGASHGRIVRQLLAEALLLSIAGGVAGLVLASLGLHTLALAMTPPLGAPSVPALALDAHVSGFAIALSCASVLTFGLMPAVRTARLENARPVRSSALLVVSEIALASILLVGAGLLVRSFVRVTTRDMGFDPSNLVMFDYRAPGPPPRQIGEYEGYQYFEVGAAPRLTLEQIFERLRAVPGVEAVAGISQPLLDSPTAAIVPVASPDHLDVVQCIVTPGFFTTLRSTRLRGRDFGDADRDTTLWTAIVNESAARLLWPRDDAIGRQIRLDIVPEERPREVIGIVADIPLQRMQIGTQPVVYTTFLQQPLRTRAPWSAMQSQMNFLLRPPVAALDAIPDVRRAIAEIDPTRPIGGVTVVSDLSPLLRERRSYALAMSVFAAVAILLAAMGVYGVVARVVAERTHEIGIRRALGAESADVVALLGRRMSWLLAAGLASGLGAAFALTRLIASQLWGVTAGDPATYVATAVLVTVAGIGAAFTPARRALAVDPTTALRTN